jgi:hypothetical protein
MKMKNSGANQNVPHIVLLLDVLVEVHCRGGRLGGEVAFYLQHTHGQRK